MQIKRFVLPVVIGTAIAALVLGGLGAPRLWAGQDVCNCPHVGDVSGDGVPDVLDLVMILSSVFDLGPVFWDPDCPKSRNDWNADGILDVQDIVDAANYIFMGGLKPINPCDCLVNPPLCAPRVDPSPGSSGNTVVVESKTVFAGQIGVPVAVKLTNLAPLRFLVVPLTVRSINAGSFMSSVQMGFGDRLIGGILDDVRSRNLYADPDGTCKPGGFMLPTYIVHRDSPFPSQPVAASPEGLLFAAGAFFIGDGLGTGADATGSLTLTMAVTTVPGSFEIDTTCVDPANHLEFIESSTSMPPIVPAFTKGIITIVQNTPPVAQCQDISVSADVSCVANAAVDNGSYDPDGGTVTLSQTPPGPYPLGATPVTLTVTDVMGAMETCLATVTVTDQTPPVLACPDSVWIRIGPGETGTIVSYLSTATDNCSVVSSVGTPPSGSFFPRGITPVTCIATDVAGLADTCQFVVNLFTDCFDRMSDVNCDGLIDVMDIVLLIDISFSGAAQVPCPAAK